MSLRDRIRDAAYSAATTSDGSPASARRASQTASVLAQAAAHHGHTATAAAVAGLGAAAVAAEAALTNYVYPPGDYAGFREDEK